MDNSFELRDLVRKLDARQLDPDYRRSFRKHGKAAITALHQCYADETASVRARSNALSVLASFCVWHGKQVRDEVLTVSINACHKNEALLREAGVLNCVFLVRQAKAYADLVGGIDDKMDDIKQAIQTAESAGLTKKADDLASEFLRNHS